MSDQRFTLRATASLLLVKDDKLLFLRRFNTGWEDGKYSLVGGHLDGNETVAETMAREAKEEIGVIIKPGDLTVVHVMHGSTNMNYIDFFLVAKKWEGNPSIMEKDKADELRWFPLTKLPDNIPLLIKQGINAYKQKQFFSEFTS